jgi:hypothetical protein
LHKANGGRIDLPKFAGGGDLSVSEQLAQDAGVPQDTSDKEPSPYPYVAYQKSTVPYFPGPDKPGVQSLDPISVHMQKPSFLQNLGENILGAADLGKTLVGGTLGMVPAALETGARMFTSPNTAQDIYEQALSHYTPDLMTQRGKEMGEDLAGFMQDYKIPLALPELMAFEGALGPGAGAALRKSNQALKALEPEAGTLGSNLGNVGNQFQRTADYPMTVSTRLPNAKGSTENPINQNLLVNGDTFKRDPEAFAHNMDLMQSYPNFNIKSKNPEIRSKEMHDQMVGNLLALHDAVPEDTRARSQLWYDGANNIVKNWENQYGVPAHAGAGMLAALSPQKDWFMNVSLGGRVMHIMREYANSPWTPEMSETAKAIYGKDQYADQLAELSGKKLNDLKDPIQKAMWLRTFDQTYFPREHSIVTPEGYDAGTRMTDKGVPYKTGWGSNNEIAKAINIFENPTRENISANLGTQHKVRNFYNNIYHPDDPSGHVTIDTHAVAAALLRPLSGKSTEVAHNFGSGVVGSVGPKNSSITGMQGTYAPYAEAYRDAAAQRGLLPRQMQSITWEAIRGLYPDTFKTPTNNAMIDNLWNQHKHGKIELNNVRQQLIGRGINEPEWK